MSTNTSNTSTLPSNWALVEGNRTWIKCDPGMANTVAGYNQVSLPCGGAGAGT